MKTLLEDLKVTLKNDGYNEFTSSDWDGLAGSERFEDGSEPLVKYVEDEEDPNQGTIYVFDANGLSRMPMDFGVHFDSINMEF